mmetsp:Transcript_61210/g.114475  ORF Transcript_61210/g.114475 Transcript_61210/m.114475 type:complete len:240 (-) Transcript_61210:54-773(-)
MDVVDAAVQLVLGSEVVDSNQQALPSSVELGGVLRGGRRLQAQILSANSLLLPIWQLHEVATGLGSCLHDADETIQVRCLLEAGDDHLVAHLQGLSLRLIHRWLPRLFFWSFRCRLGRRRLRHGRRSKGLCWLRSFWPSPGSLTRADWRMRQRMKTWLRPGARQGRGGHGARDGRHNLLRQRHVGPNILGLLHIHSLDGRRRDVTPHLRRIPGGGFPKLILRRARRFRIAGAHGVSFPP